jgi:hypothetical protein
MNRTCASLCLAASIMMTSACGGNVVVDHASTGSGGMGAIGAPTGTAGHGTGGAPVACPGKALFDNSQVIDLVGKPCANADDVCSNNNGCGGCSVTCVNGVWTSTNPQLCYTVGGTC